MSTTHPRALATRHTNARGEERLQPTFFDGDPNDLGSLLNDKYRLYRYLPAWAESDYYSYLNDETVVPDPEEDYPIIYYPVLFRSKKKALRVVSRYLKKHGNRLDREFHRV